MLNRVGSGRSAAFLKPVPNESVHPQSVLGEVRVA